MKTLEHLLTPIRIKSLDIANRVVMPPMGTGLGNEDGTVSEANLAYLRRRARSGAGLYITEITEIDPVGAVAPTCLGIWDDTFIPGLRKMADIVHAAGSNIAMQLHHCGRESLYQTRKRTAVAPSAVGSFLFGFIAPPREMTPEEIQQTIRAFGEGARRAKAAGFDAVELHGAHGYLLMQFLSAFSNQRTDEYGGDFRGRARFMLECLAEVRRQVGDDFPISIRISGEEGIQGGYTIDDMLTIVPDLVKAGADLIHVSFGTHGNAKIYTDTPNPSAPIEYAPGFKTDLARKIKAVAGVPVITVGRYTDPYFMDEVIARGDADFVAVGRQHLADPDFLINAREGRSEETFECLACNQGCIEREALEGQPVRCAINVETGQELIYPTQPAQTPRNVWVIGAGPAGLTAADEAARLGHKVTLFEKEAQIGGQIRYAEKAPHKAAYGKWIRTLAARAVKRGVDLRTGTEVTEAMIDQNDPEVVILAIGADKAECPAPGRTMSVVCDAWEILNGEVPPREDAVVIGGGLVGMETADFLCQQGIRHVTLVEMLAKPPVRPISAHGTMLHRRLAAAGARLMFDTRVERIEEGAVIVSTAGVEKRLAPVGQVIVAVGVTPRQELKQILERKGIRHVVVGDAKHPRRIIEATTEGAQAAWEI
jgi:2,4-dienoyl-CoA reductase-like NADH-dependent reductase (Old Yellow Enzyme family)/NADPH-dependent 2,4-dienoyl-CoA reductase/sulfur reductase-like enzyme